MSTYSGGLASARFICRAAEQLGKLPSCVCLSWVHSAFTSVYLSVCLGLGVRYSTGH